MTSDIEIAQKYNKLPITEIAAKVGIPDEYLEPYGKYKAKIDISFLQDDKTKRDGKLVLVTAINPTPAGEGKTTTTIGLADALNRLGKKTVVREMAVFFYGRKAHVRLVPSGGGPWGRGRLGPGHVCCRLICRRT